MEHQERSAFPTPQEGKIVRECQRKLVLFVAVIQLASGIAASQPAGVGASKDDASPKEWTRGMRVHSTGMAPTRQLSFQFKPGQFAHYEVTQRMLIVSKYPQAEEKMQNESVTTKHYRVVAADASGVAQLEPMIDHVRMSVRFNDLAPNAYDSKVDVNPPQGFEDVAKSVGKAMARVHLTPNGELTKVTVLDGAPPALATAAADADPKLNFLIPLPKEPVGVGAVWKDRFQTPVVVGQGLTQPVTMQREFELKKIEGSLATIAFKTTVITPIGNPQVEAQLLQRKPSGVIEFDIDRGLILSQRTTASGEVFQAFGPNTAMQAALETTERWLPQTTAEQPTASRN